MTRGNKILLVALVVQLVLAIVMLTRDKGGGIAALEDVAPKLDATKVTKVQIFDHRAAGATEPEKPAIELTASGLTWSLASHFGYPADRAKVTKLLTDLTNMQARGAMTRGVSRHAQLGVADGEYERKVVITDDTGERVLFIGKNAGGRQTAVRRGGDNAVYGVPGISSFAIDAQPRGWIDETYATIAVDDVAAIEVTQAGATTALDRTSGPWQLLASGVPVVLAATEQVDLAKADNLLEGLSSISLVAPGDPARDASAPTATITLRMKAPPAPPPPMTDAGVPAAVSVPPPAAPPPRIFDVIADGEKYWLRERGNPRAAIVEKSTLATILGISKATFVTTATPPPMPPPG